MTPTSRTPRAPRTVAVVALALALAAGCTAGRRSPSPPSPGPLEELADVELPGAAVRFDYQDVDVAHGHLIIAHMNDASVVVVDVGDGSAAKVLPGIPTARGVVVAPEVDRIFVTSAPDRLVIVDAGSLAELGRVATGQGPDGVAWDPIDRIVGVSDQRDGALSLIADAGDGARTQVPLGDETGNVIYDRARGLFWITVVPASPPDLLIAIDPRTRREAARIALPGCAGAHGLRLHPDGASALVACEDGARLARVELDGDHAIALAVTGADPDVLAIDPGLGWLYVAAESGDLAVFDLAKPGLVAVGRQHAGDHAHTVAVDPASHHVFFPLLAGPAGTPVLRIMQPAPR